jgi:DNA polymerase-3 subunit delta'
MEVTGQATLHDIPLPWQQEVWQGLLSRVSQGALPHALLISGQPGLGKLLLATAFANLALCREPTASGACGRCAGCVQFAAGSHPDFSRVMPLEDKSSISVEQIRTLIGSLQLKSQHGGRKVALIEPAEAMTGGGANSLLKTLEEPPPETLLLLVTAQPGRLPATVRSRCQSISLGLPPEAGALAWLAARTSRPDWAVWLGLAGGAPLAALQLADSDLAKQRTDFLQALLRLRKGEASAMELARQSKDFYQEVYPDLLRLLWSFVADLILIRTAGMSAPLVNCDQLPLLQMASEGLNLRRLYAYLDRVQIALRSLEAPVNRELTFTVLLGEWAGGLEDLQHSPLAARTNWG